MCRNPVEERTQKGKPCRCEEPDGYGATPSYNAGYEPVGVTHSINTGAAINVPRTKEGHLCRKTWTSTRFGGRLGDVRCDSYCCNEDNDPRGDWCMWGHDQGDWDYCETPRTTHTPGGGASRAGMKCLKNWEDRGKK